MNIQTDIQIDDAEIRDLVSDMLSDEGLTVEPFNARVKDAVQETMSDIGFDPEEYVSVDDFDSKVESAIDDYDFTAQVESVLEDQDDIPTRDDVQGMIDESTLSEDAVYDTVTEGIQRYMREDFDIDDAVDQRLRYHDFLEESGVEDVVLNTMLAQLESLPTSVDGRCQLGRAFQNAVVSILTNVTSGDLEVPGLATALMTMTAQQAAMAAAAAEVAAVGTAPAVVKQFVLVVRGETVDRTDQANEYLANQPVDGQVIVGPFPTTAALTEWAEASGRHGTMMVIDTPTA